jgi:Actin-like ATPase involved in cell morphogenesis
MSQLQGLAERVSNEVRVRVWVAEDPMTCVARGAGIVLDNLDEYEQLLVGIERDPYTSLTEG